VPLSATSVTGTAIRLLFCPDVGNFDTKLEVVQHYLDRAGGDGDSLKLSKPMTAPAVTAAKEDTSSSQPSSVVLFAANATPTLKTSTE
jgi:hypothetical protein